MFDEEGVTYRIVRTLQFDLLNKLLAVLPLYVIDIVSVDGSEVGTLSEIDYLELHNKGECEFVFVVEAYGSEKDVNEYVDQMVQDAHASVQPILVAALF